MKRLIVGVLLGVIAVLIIFDFEYLPRHGLNNSGDWVCVGLRGRNTKTCRAIKFETRERFYD